MGRLTAAAVVGYATFGRHPALLARFPGALSVYAVAFAGFARAHVLLAFAALAVALGRVAGARWLGALAGVYAASLASESGVWAWSAITRGM